MISEESIQEVRRHEEARMVHEQFENNMLIELEHIRDIITDDQFRSWKLVETIIMCKGENKYPAASATVIREKLRSMSL